MSLKVQAGLNLATASILLAVATTMATGATWLAKRFSDMDTRLGKLESAIKVLNAASPDERYREAIKELIAAAGKSGANYVRRRSATIGFECSEDGKDWSLCAAAGAVYPADAGASASSPAMVKPQ